MNTHIDYLRSFIERLRSVNFLQRIFNWKSVRNQLIDAAASVAGIQSEYQNAQVRLNDFSNKLSDCTKDVDLLRDQKARWEENVKTQSSIVAARDGVIASLQHELTTANTNCSNLEKQVQSYANELSALKETVKHLQQDLKQSSETCISLTKDEDARRKEHSNAMATLKTLSDQVQKERAEEKALENERQLTYLSNLKETWINHQAEVNTCIQKICHQHTIEFIHKFPFKGEPDNCIKICDEYIVFDAKSPAGDDPSNFFSYLKDQAEKARKYALQESVKPDVFFVVPANMAVHIKQTSFHMGDYNVYIIFTDSLEPIILTLKKIENYEFAEQLSPEERENICRVLGKFAHLTKRRIQVDSFFAKQFMELVFKCESSLPEDILKEVAAFEKSEKLNPPIEKRSKAINSRQLEIEVGQLETDAINKGIVIEDLSEGLNKVKLYRE